MLTVVLPCLWSASTLASAAEPSATNPSAAAPAHIDGSVVALALDWRPDLMTAVSLPERSRPLPQGDVVPVAGSWRLVSTVAGVRTWQAALPVRPRTLFFNNPPEGLEVLLREGDQPWTGATTLRHRHGLDDIAKADTWEFTSTLLRVRRPIAAGSPKQGQLGVRYAVAVDRETALQRSAYDGSDQEFLMRSFQVGDTTRHGLFLPAPARVSFTVKVPHDGVFRAEPGLLPPEAALAGVHSDGATLVLRVDDQVVARDQLAVGDFSPVHHDLSAWAGQTITLSLAVEPGDGAQLDYALIASPSVYQPQAHPRRVVILFVDTLRQDELSLYGYARPTTPDIDAWAANATVFDDARSAAPWTLPSTRAFLLGAQPEAWGQQQSLQERASTAGWATAFLAGNVYLSTNFDMEQGFGTHRCINWPTADIEVARTRSWLKANADRPALVVLHTMDMHLPYTEPRSYRRIFAGDLPPEFGTEHFLRRQVLSAVSKLGDEGKQYVRDRYDNNLRFVNDQLAGLLADLSPDDTVVFMSDHGEEFWDHRGYEHGHTLYDELLRVPLVIAGPDFAASRVPTAVSLMDVAPTLASVMGLSTDGMTGLDLGPLAQPGAVPAAFRSRPLGFGRPLYGHRSWGVLDGDIKYVSLEGAERAYDLSKDPGEHTDLVRTRRVDRAALAASLSVGIEAPVATVLRLLPASSSSRSDLVVTATVPGGFDRVWAGDDPLHAATVTIAEAEEPAGTQSEDAEPAGTATITWVGHAKGQREVYLLPHLPLDQALPQLQLTVAHKGPAAVDMRHASGNAWPPAWSGRSTPLFRGRAGGRAITVDYARVPVPAPDDIALVGVDSELQRDLEALGYVGR